MKNLYFAGLFLFLGLFSTNLQAYFNLKVLNPDAQWQNGQGTIEEAAIAVKPHGIYNQVDLYLTLSDKGLNINADQLEIVLDFELPEEAFIIDSWLWIGEEIVQAELWDRWSATTVYEDIVDRNQDPSVLYKDSDIDYQLRIFPLIPSERRKVKISYMVPGNWTADNVLVSLPLEILRTSKYAVNNVELIAFAGGDWVNPTLLGSSNLSFTAHTTPDGQLVKAANLVSLNDISSLNLVWESPLNNGVYANKFEAGDESVYEVVVMPNALLDIEISKNVLVLLDYTTNNSNIVRQEIVEIVKNQLLMELGPNDNFNIVFSKPTPYLLHDNWIPASMVEEFFDQLPELIPDYWSSYTNLPGLLENGLNFIEEQGQGGSIFLVANSDDFHSFTVANELIEDLLSDVSDITINVLDFQHLNFETTYGNGAFYSGNEYLYSVMSQMTAGLFERIDLDDFSESLGTLIKSSESSTSVFDFYTDLGDGFNYGRHNIGNSQFLSLNDPLMQVGKYVGDFPLNIELTGIFEEQVFSETMSIAEEDIAEVDDRSTSVWAAQHLKELESFTATNEQILEIINYSKENRVLSLYTTFICLEPSQGGEICENCVDESDIETPVTTLLEPGPDSEPDFGGEYVIGSEAEFLEDIDAFIGIEEADFDFDLKVYPNPFEDQLVIDFANVEDLIVIEIYNAQGQLIRIFELNEFQNGQLVWDALDINGVKVRQGLYLLRIVSQKGVQTHKVLKK